MWRHAVGIPLGRQSLELAEHPLAAQNRAHREVVGRPRHVVHAQDRGALRRRPTRARRACRDRGRPARGPVIAPMKSLREAASRIGRPSARSRSIRRSTRDGLRGRLGEVRPGIEDQLLDRDRPPPAQHRSACAGTRRPRSPRPHTSPGSSSVPFGSTAVCMSTSAAPVDAHNAARRVSRSPDTSLTIAAPASIAAAATSYLYVSIDVRTSSLARARDQCFDTRAISSAAETAGRSPRADSPPMSMMSAPAATSARPALHPHRQWLLAALVRERVRRGVEDPHQQGAGAQRQRPLARPQDHDFLMRQLRLLARHVARLVDGGDLQGELAALVAMARGARSASSRTCRRSRR